jgi:hypothetical protein
MYFFLFHSLTIFFLFFYLNLIIQYQVVLEIMLCNLFIFVIYRSHTISFFFDSNLQHYIC